MKTPAPPPDYQSLLVRASTNGDRFVEILLRDAVNASTDEYLPWDRLRYQEPPSGLSHEEWWLLSKIARKSLRRPLPLRAKDGTAFTYAMPDRVLGAVEGINRDASGQIAISEQVTNPGTRNGYVISSLIEEVITSSQMEGAVTTCAVAKDMLRSGRPPRDRGERMIVANFRAMQRITEVRDEPSTPGLVREIHSIVTEGTLADPAMAGRLQTSDEERVGVYGDSDQQLLHLPPAVEELPDRLESLCRFANGTSDESYVPAVLRAVAIHFMVGYDHYFEDGNGRTARALFYWAMLRQGFWLAEFLTISTILRAAPAQYARSFLLTEQDDGDLTHFFVYHVRIIERAIADLRGYLGRKAVELREVQASTAAAGEFNHRQPPLIEAAVSGPGDQYTMQSHARSHRVSHETARHDLMDLERRGLFVKGRSGRRFAWSAAPDLVSRLRGVG